MTVDKRELYRFPWSMNDNPIAWLEVSDICNIHCEGCYRQYMTGHKSLDQIKEEVLFFKRWRNPDNVSLAGGEPLIHPQILDIVAFIRQNKIKPIILTNALTLTPELLRELKKAGLAGFTIHIDSHQGRPGWVGKSEKEHNQLRQKYADMIAEVGGLYVVFNSTVYPSTFQEIPDVAAWAQSNIDRVHGLVFITYRTATESQVGTDVTKQEVDLTKLSYVRDRFDERFVTSPEVYRILQEHCSQFVASGYLGGSIRHDSIKWLSGALIGSRKAIYGSVGKKAMEASQVFHHLMRGTYLAYMAQARIGSKVFMGAPFDKGIKEAARRWGRDVLRHPGRLFEPIYVQSIGIIQAPDVMPDGRADMCDSCPDITIHEGQFVNSCRLDEYRLFGGFLSLTDKQSSPDTPPHPQESGEKAGES
ncbi:MAG: radical SAM protein [Coprothermobacterota bacterium]|nr:radical SAM protein [Coprothermobacterota bacterium]